MIYFERTSTIKNIESAGEELALRQCRTYGTQSLISFYPRLTPWATYLRPLRGLDSCNKSNVGISRRKGSSYYRAFPILRRPWAARASAPVGEEACGETSDPP